MKTFLATFALVLALHSASAEEKIALVQPKSARLALTKIIREHDLYAEYKGQIRISGVLVAEWVGGRDNVNYKEPEYSIVPDRASTKRLPHFSGYSVRFIQLLNGKEALTMAAGSADTERLLNRKTAQIKVAGSFVISGYSVGVECDASWAKAKLIRADIPAKRLAAIAQPIEEC